MMLRLSILSFCLLAARLFGANGFAYAPNFITKIIQEQTSITPKGLLQIDSTEPQVELKNGQCQHVDKVVKTRFPPEPNGYLHLGHAKAVSFNFAVARMFDGVCHMRLDDTNPSKEEKEYVESILEDVMWIQKGLYDGEQPWDGPVRKTSDYFDLIYDCAVALIKSGDAYVDSLTAEEMKEYRGTLTEPGKDSPYRTRSIEENLELFEGMRAGKFPDGAHVLRAKIDMSSPNINLRDPTLYRIKHESHQETGDKWCIYPMYDFSHPIADAVEDITHSLCTLEFEDHRPFYDWTVEKLLPTGLISARPQQIEFSRLNIKSTVLSKRKLIQLVTEKHVNGWDDPRMPTLSGMRRRGIPPSALRLFCERVGISKADSNIDYAVLEDCVRETMDAECARAFCVLKPLKVTITNLEGELEEFEVARHPKIDSMGSRIIPFGKTVFIERTDFFDTDGPEGRATNGKPPKGFKRLLPNGMVRLRYAYVIQCDEIVRDSVTGEPVELKCTYFPDTRAGNTPEGMNRVNGIVHWVECSTAVDCTVNQYDRLFKTEEPGKESGDFLSDINPDSFEVIEGVKVEPSVALDVNDLLAKMRNDKGSAFGGKMYLSALAYQFERSGYFALDTATSGSENIVFNRVATLRDTWGTQKSEGQSNQRNRGGNKAASSETQKISAAPVEDVRRVSFRAATILSAESHPEADSLLLLKVDCGDVSDNGNKGEPRTVVAGLAGKYSPDELVGKKVVAVTNLKPARMRGIDSHAMLLAASRVDSNEEKVELLEVPDSVPAGELLYIEGKEPSQPDTMMKSKGALNAFNRVKEALRSNENKEAVFVEDGNPFRLLTSAGPVTVSTLVNAAIQ